MSDDIRAHRTGHRRSTEVDLVIGGMTCASCAARIEKRLNRLDGVTATVNYATEQAKVHAPEAVSVDELVAQVEAAGYTARPARPSPARLRRRAPTGGGRGRRDPHRCGPG